MNTEPRPTPRAIAAEFARTGELVRLDVAGMNFIAAHPHYVAGTDGTAVLVSPLAFCAVDPKVFACLFHVGVATVGRWILDGMPTMEGSEFIPYEAARRWHQGQQLQRAEAQARLAEAEGEQFT